MNTSSSPDTIVAIATPPGRGGIGVVRVSGPDALRIGERIAGRALRPRHAHHCLFRDREAEPLDDGLVIAFPAPHSFTGEHVVELQGHGGPVVLDRVLRACLQLGARLARPGEFSERAFLNDRMDLAQAEAVADLIESASEAAAKGALRTLQGEFSRRVHALMEQATGLRIHVEAAIDFPDEEVDFLAEGDVRGRIETLRSALAALLVEAGRGVLLTDGMTLVLAGPPNAGKSSLMNALAGRETAIVTSVPGTTRDVLRETINLDGMPVRIIDTAGLRQTDDQIEAEGVRRARAEIRGADVLLYLVDASEETATPATRDELETLVGEALPRHLVVVRNKIDLLGEQAGPAAPGAMVHSLSVLSGDGMDALVTHLEALVGHDGAGTSQFTARTRHLDALQRAAICLDEAHETLVATGAGDLVAEDLRRAHDSLGEIVGVVTADDLLGRIFSSFCIGK